MTKHPAVRAPALSAVLEVKAQCADGRVVTQYVAEDTTVTAHQVTHVENDVGLVGGQVLQGGA